MCLASTILMLTSKAPIREAHLLIGGFREVWKNPNLNSLNTLMPWDTGILKSNHRVRSSALGQNRVLSLQGDRVMSTVGTLPTIISMKNSHLSLRQRIRANHQADRMTNRSNISQIWKRSQCKGRMEEWDESLQSNILSLRPKGWITHEIIR